MLIAIERGIAGHGTLEVEQLPSDSHIAAVTLSEMRVGILLADTEARAIPRQRLLDRVRRLAPILPFGEAEAETHATLRVALRSAGTAIGAEDLLIAATAVTHGHGVITYNVAEFRRVTGLQVLTLDGAGRLIET